MGEPCYCSFCGKSQHDVRKLIAGPTVFICNECSDLCHEIVTEEQPTGKRGLDLAELDKRLKAFRHDYCGQSADAEVPLHFVAEMAWALGAQVDLKMTPAKVGTGAIAPIDARSGETGTGSIGEADESGNSSDIQEVNHG